MTDLTLHPNCGFCGRRFRTQNLPAHERVCGRGLADRYRILAVTGCVIAPATFFGAKKITTSYCVCDGNDLWHEVGWFVPTQGFSGESCRKRAEALCRELNLEELMAA